MHEVLQETCCDTSCLQHGFSLTCMLPPAVFSPNTLSICPVVQGDVCALLPEACGSLLCVMFDK